MRSEVDGHESPCNKDLTGLELCPNRSNHVLPFRTGFCAGKQQCEGKTPVSPSGKPMRVCTFWLTCPCECHARITRMFIMAEEPRLVMENPKYVPPTHTAVMPTPEEIALLRAQRKPDQKVTIKESDSDEIPAVVIREFDHSGQRAGRGELEQNVRLACDQYVKSGSEEDCGTLWVQEWIYTQSGTRPSRGAIGAVFERWKTLGFAMFFKSPIRFVCYTPDGIKYGLEGLKDRAKSATKQAASLQARGIRR